MKSHKWYFIKGVCFLVLVTLLVHGINKIMIPKFYFDNTWPTTTGLKGFYKMEENTIDVIYLGSSHAATSYSPQAAYDYNGLKSYNLSCEQQNMLTSYYWLKEAYRFQKPKVVVLDTFMLYDSAPSEPLNSPESTTRKAIDTMKWSEVKWEAIHDIAEHDSKQSVSSYIFTNIRFHDRWKSLTEQDFEYPMLDKKFELKGYVPLSAQAGSEEYTPFVDYTVEENEKMLPLMNYYLDKIVELCKENNTKLILVKTPTLAWNTAKHKAVSEYALQNNLDFIDYNDSATLASTGFIFTEDMNDYGHPNIWGAEKLSIHMATLLEEQYGIRSVGDSEMWRDTYNYYQDIKRDCELSNISDIYEYLQAINQSRYTVLIAVSTDATGILTDELISAFSDLGFNMNLEEKESYYGVIADGAVIENHSMEAISYIGSTRNKKVDYEVASSGYYAGSSCSIKIDNTQYALGGAGINIVVYCNETWKVIDSIAYNGEIVR